jgi:hypothetical protein
MMNMPQVGRAIAVPFCGIEESPHSTERGVG